MNVQNAGILMNIMSYVISSTSKSSSFLHYDLNVSHTGYQAELLWIVQRVQRGLSRSSSALCSFIFSSQKLFGYWRTEGSFCVHEV